MRAWFRLECSTLLATAPVMLLMYLSYLRDGLVGAAVVAAVFGLLVLIAHYAFEVVMLREQVRAMEKLSVVTLAQTNPKKVVERFVQLSSKLILCDRSTLSLEES